MNIIDIYLEKLNEATRLISDVPKAKQQLMALRKAALRRAKPAKPNATMTYGKRKKIAKVSADADAKYAARKASDQRFMST